MPISKYYGGHGEQVMRDMEKRYGKRAESVFYATANKQKQREKTPSKLSDTMKILQGRK